MIQVAASRAEQRYTGASIPITSSASISSVIRIVPSSATNPVETFAAIM